MLSGREITILGPPASEDVTAPSARLSAFAEHFQREGWTVHRPVDESQRPASEQASFTRYRPLLRKLADLMRLEGDCQPSLVRTFWHQASSTRSDVTLLSVPPFSGLVGSMVRYGSPRTVVDFRDLWLHNTRVPSLNRLSSWLERQMAARLDAITFAGTAAFGDLLSRMSGLPADRVVSVPNGVRSEDLPAAGSPRQHDGPRDGPLRLVFAGSVYGRHQLRHVAQAVDKLGARRVRLEVIGPSPPDQLARCLVSTGSGLTSSPALSRPELYRRILAADVAVIALADSFPHEFSIPVKAYEYFALGMPTLVIAPGASPLVRLAGPSLVERIDPDDGAGIEALLAELADRRDRLVRAHVERDRFDRSIGLDRLNDLVTKLVRDD